MDTPMPPYENPINPAGITTPPQVGQPVKKQIHPVFIIGAAIIVVLIGAVVGVSLTRPQKPAVLLPTPTPAPPTPTPTPVRRLSAVASQSAFLEYQTSVQSLSDAVAAYTTSDQTVSPPVLVLPLGITQ